MASSLKLMLERVISANRLSSALELPLERKLGDLPRLKYVYADALPLPLSERISNQPAASALPLGLTRKLGTTTGGYVPPVEPPVNDDLSVTIAAVADLTPTASATLTTETVEVGVSVIAHCDLNATASASVDYDANVFRGLIADVSSDMQDAKLQGIGKSGQFEDNEQLVSSTTADWQQSRLIGTDNQAQFEANKRLNTDTTPLFESSKLVGADSQQLYESQRFIADKSTLKTETAKRISHSNWYSFEAMLKRQIERTLGAEYAELVTDRLDTSSEHNRLTALSYDMRREFARLPYSKLRYVPPPLSQTVILKEQIIEVWECGSGALRHYIYYNSELPLPMTRRIADRGASGLALTMPRSTLVLSAIEADALPNRPCRRKTLAVNPTLDITMCELEYLASHQAWQ